MLSATPYTKSDRYVVTSTFTPDADFAPFVCVRKFATITEALAQVKEFNDAYEGDPSMYTVTLEDKGA